MRYEFKRPDGEWVEKEFPIGTCPSEITCDDGVVARRGWRTAPSVSWKPGQESEYEKIRKKEQRTKDNLAAGDRGRNEWRERMPKLRLE